MDSQFAITAQMEDLLNRYLTASMRSLFFEPCTTPEQTAFFHRYLLGHLVHTACILERWGESEELCRAGVLHSLYGTEAFSSPFYPFSPIALARREEVRDIIGPQTEYLVYAFCALQRAVFLQNIGQAGIYSFFDRFQQTTVSLNEHDYRALLLLTVADWIEPAFGKKVAPQLETYVRQYYRQEFMLAAPLLPEQAIQDVRQVYGLTEQVGQERAEKERQE